jgi:hypothetical protein
VISVLGSDMTGYEKDFYDKEIANNYFDAVINLNDVFCKLISIEHNGNQEIKKSYIDYCSKFNFKIIGETEINILMGR